MNNHYKIIHYKKTFDALIKNKTITSLGRYKSSFYINKRKLFFKEEVDRMYYELLGNSIAEYLNINYTYYEPTIIKTATREIKGLVAKDYRREGYSLVKFNKLLNGKEMTLKFNVNGKEIVKNVKVSSIKKFFRRIETWRNRVDRYSDDTPLYKQPRTKENAQEHFARMAQANSKVIGTGPGNSRECSRLPLAYIDYVYSIIVEELGYAGGIVVLVLYLWLFARAGSIAWRCKRTFPALLVMGMAVFIVFQALFHICINVGVMPVSGQPLPLISKGGTSILITCMAFGIMLSVSRTAVQSNKSKEVKEEIEQLPTDLQGSNLSQK